MCGIAGIAALGLGREPDASELGCMSRALIHRGPDAEYIDIEGSVGFSVRRLAVIDPRGGRQPLTDEQGTVRAIFNGEIYDFQEHQTRLRNAGHVLNSSSDGEVIPHLWQDSGSGFVRRLNGMFAIALHDVETKELWLFRDRFGIKPLYYQFDENRFLFGSEIKALLAVQGTRPNLDMTALAEFLAWEYVPGPATLFEGIHKLPPGSSLKLDLTTGSHAIGTWWDLATEATPETDDRSPEDWAREVDNRLRSAVHRQLNSDVPLGTFLSGGVDSSLVASAMGQAQSFSIGFDQPSYDETGWARQVAQHLDLSHRIEILTPDAADLFDRLMHFNDDPIADFSIFPTHLVSKLAREEVTVALTGDGGDEIFGGYETYVAQHLAHYWSLVPRSIHRFTTQPILRRLRPRPAKKGLINRAKRFAEGAVMPAELEHTRWRLFMDSDFLGRLLTPEARKEIDRPIDSHVAQLFSRCQHLSPLKRRLYVDLYSYLVDNCLTKVDRMTMAVSLEARVPFLDHDLALTAFSLPDDLLVSGLKTKVLLKRIARQHLPTECVERPKEGFSIPIKDWLNHQLRPQMEHLLEPSRLQSQGLFDPSVVGDLRRAHHAGTANHSHRLWALLVFQDWLDRWGVS